MRENIVNKLNEIEATYNIEILYACESGSRAWGFPSVDSDYDVRFIYKSKREVYLSVFEEPTEFGFPIVGDLDFVGWDIKKVFRLLCKSNVTPFEWLQSPIVYKEKKGFSAFMKAILCDFYDEKRHIHHYLGIVRGRMEAGAFEAMKLKSFFYTMRSLLSAYWNMKYKEYAPMEFAPLTTLLPKDMRDTVQALLSIKRLVDESYVFHLNDELRAFILDLQVEIWAYADTLESISIPKEQANVEFLKLWNDDYRNPSCATSNFV